MRLRWLTGPLMLLGLFAPGRVAAQGAESWAVLEYRMLLREAEETRPRASLRIISDSRFAQTTSGLDQMFLRVGPIFDLEPWLFLAIHGTAIADRRGDGTFGGEYRVELEPNFQGRRGSLSWSDRNRIEYRFGDKQRIRYRNLLRLNWAPQGALWMPFLWEEVLLEEDIEVTDQGFVFNQNRLSLGVARKLPGATRLDLGYLLRSKLVGGEWLQDHVLWLNLFVGIPAKKAPAPEPPQPVSVPTSAPGIPSY